MRIGRGVDGGQQAIGLKFVQVNNCLCNDDESINMALVFHISGPIISRVVG